MDVIGELGDIFQGELIFREYWIEFIERPRPLGIMGKWKTQLN